MFLASALSSRIMHTKVSSGSRLPRCADKRRFDYRRPGMLGSFGEFGSTKKVSHYRQEEMVPDEALSRGALDKGGEDALLP